MIGCLTLDVGLFTVVNNGKSRTTVTRVRANSNDGVQPVKRPWPESVLKAGASSFRAALASPSLDGERVVPSAS